MPYRNSLVEKAFTDLDARLCEFNDPFFKFRPPTEAAKDTASYLMFKLLEHTDIVPILAPGLSDGTLAMEISLGTLWEIRIHIGDKGHIGALFVTKATNPSEYEGKDFAFAEYHTHDFLGDVLEEVLKYEPAGYVPNHELIGCESGD